MLRYAEAHIEVPTDGSLRAIKIYVKSQDGQDLTIQQVLDAVSDALLESLPWYDLDPYEPQYDA